MKRALGSTFFFVAVSLGLMLGTMRAQTVYNWSDTDPGNFSVSGQLTVNASGVVTSGWGTMDAASGTYLFGDGQTALTLYPGDTAGDYQLSPYGAFYFDNVVTSVGTASSSCLPSGPLLDYCGLLFGEPGGGTPTDIMVVYSALGNPTPTPYETDAWAGGSGGWYYNTDPNSTFTLTPATPAAPAVPEPSSLLLVGTGLLGLGGAIKRKIAS